MNDDRLTPNNPHHSRMLDAARNANNEVDYARRWIKEFAQPGTSALFHALLNHLNFDPDGQPLPAPPNISVDDFMGNLDAAEIATRRALTALSHALHALGTLRLQASKALDAPATDIVLLLPPDATR